ncbi:MAG: damage-inducible protein DinB [Acidobacteria bacterium]|nr:damage-inducible protein DinB [Acidobacteriota bacterium]
MLDVRNANLLEALLDSWDRNNTILINLLRAVPEGGLEVRAMESSPSVGEMLMHIHYVRLVFVSEDAPDFAKPMPEGEWRTERDRNRNRMVQMLNDSAKVVRDVLRNRVETCGQMNLHYDHPVLFLQHMIWHEGYHHGQIKLALKLAGHPISDDEAGPGTWSVWMNKKD